MDEGRGTGIGSLIPHARISLAGYEFLHLTTQK